MTIIDPTLNLVARRWRSHAMGYGWPLVVSRASIATRFDATGKLISCVSGALRHDFDPLTGEYLGVLIEGQRTNLLLGSADLGNASYWTAEGATVAANAAVAPDGNTAADRLTYSSGNNRINQSVLISAAAANYTLSAYVKADTATYTRVEINAAGGADPTTGTSVVINLGAGTVAVLSGAGSAAIRAIGNGWYRVSVTHQSSASHNLLVAYAYGSTNAAGAAAAGSSYWWGLQSEAGSFPTSYIATAASDVTRLADVLTVPTSAFAYNQLEGTLLARFDTPTTAVVPAVLYADNNNYAAFDVTSPYKARAVIAAGGPTVATLASGTFVASAATAAALAYKANDFALCVDGGTVLTDTSGAVPSPATALHIGAFNGNSILNGHIRQISYFPRRLSNADLQALTL